MEPTSVGFTTSQGIHNLSPREAVECCKNGAVLLDVREDYSSQFKQFAVPEVLQIPMSRLDKELQRVPKDKWIILADSAGLRSKEAYLLLREKGFPRISNLAGGLVEWERDGMPLFADTAERLSGSCACQLKPRERKQKESRD